MFHRMLRVAATTLALSLALTMADPARANAQGTDPVEGLEQLESGFKGTFGLGILGAELGFVIPAAAGLDQWWALVVFPVIGGAGGALAGYYGLDNNNQLEVSTALLVIGVALIVPTAVLTAALRSYDGDQEEVQSDDVAAAAAAEASARRRSESIARAGTGLLRRSEYGLHLGMPGVAVGSRGATTRDDLLLGTRPATEVRISLFSGVF